MSSVEDVLRAAGIGPSRIDRLFSPAESDLDAEKQIAESRSGHKLADLNLYYDIAVPAGVSIEALCDALNALPSVELAAPAPLPARTPADMAPATPDYQSVQGYRLNAPQGIGASEVTAVAGADGAGNAIVDIEYDWVLDHEDLELDASANIDSAALYDPYPQDEGNHGTAVLEVLGGPPNAYGVTGVVPEATLSWLRDDDCVWLQRRARGELGRTNPRARRCHPDRATGLRVRREQFRPDRVVFADLRCDRDGHRTRDRRRGGGRKRGGRPRRAGVRRWFDRGVRDWARIVGAGKPDSRTRLSFSTYGSRVDLQGCGESVATAGYGALFDPGDVRQRYTDHFSGTSSASPIVAGAVAAVQGALLAQEMDPLAPAEIASCS